MRISLQLKLALISLVLLVIPITGFRLSGILKDNLLESRRETLMFSARAVASALAGRPGLFDRELFHALDQSRDLYLIKLSDPMRLNGKIEGWESHMQAAEEYGKDHVIFSAKPYDSSSVHFKYLVGQRGEYLWAIFLVTDHHVVYQETGSDRLDRSDHLQIGLEDKNGKLHRYIMTARKPGWINAYEIPEGFDEAPPVENDSIQGVWAETPEGYNIEIRMPLAMVGHKLAFAVADVNDPVTRDIETIVGTADPGRIDQIGWLLPPSTSIIDILKSLNRPHSRILIVDSNHHVRASYGSLKAGDDEVPASKDHGLDALIGLVNRILSPLYRLFTEPLSSDFTDSSPQSATLDIKGVEEGLEGRGSITNYRIAKGQVEVMAATTPLFEKEKVIGVVVVEQTTNAILALKNKVIEESIGMTILFFLFGGIGIFLFAFRISSRIRRLRNQAAEAITANGQILDILPPTSSRDEIGDLSRTLASMLSQLKNQSEYREKMADNLEHEMRTPLASVSASLKNLAKETKDLPDHLNNYVNWALSDVLRLEELLTSIRDATSLREALNEGFRENFDLAEALSLWIAHSWQPAFPTVEFLYKRPEDAVPINGDPDRIRQMLDKLIENGIAFHAEGSPIELRLSRERDGIRLQVTNKGPEIPEERLGQIFNSMVSIRTQKDAKPHLGLGLFIVRTIVEHHRGTVTAGNRTDGQSGAVFTIRLPS
ncbi:MAG: ATP-binding protein [Desulfocapsaceae bacterium]|nr:ATP-binding protein [Desulfocapsaceae bacterium]